MKIPSGLAPRYLLFAVAILGLAVLQACQYPGAASNAPYAFQFHYATKPTPVSPDEAARFARILIKHHVQGKLTLDGVLVVSLPPKIKADGVTMALQTQGGIKPSGSWKTQLVGLLEASSEKDLKGALHEFSGSTP